jgi:hypothetical protein
LMIEQNSEFISWFDDRTKFRIYQLVFSLMSVLCSCRPSFFIIIHQSEIQLDWVLPNAEEKNVESRRITSKIVE